MAESIETRYAIVGAGTAGIAAIEALREIDRTGKVVLVNGEKVTPYCRPLIIEMLTGERTAEQICIREPQWYRQQGVTLIDGDPVVDLGIGARRLTLASGRTVAWERLLLTPGGIAAPPPVEGLSDVPVFQLVSQEDVLRLRPLCRRGARALLVGIGLIGLQALTALRKLGVDVVALEACPKVLPMILDAEAAAYAQRRLTDHGLEVHVGTALRTLRRSDQGAAACDQNGRNCIALTGDDQEIGFDFLVLATGMQPNLTLVKDTDIVCQRGIVVTDRMQTSVPGVYAAGDVTQSINWIERRPEVHAHWVNAHHQGRIAGVRMAGGFPQPYVPFYLNALRVFGLPIITMGASRMDDFDDAQVYKTAQPSRDAYTRLVVRQGRLIAATFVKDVARAGVFQHLMREGIPIGDVAASLLAEDRAGMEFLREIHQPAIEGQVDWPTSMDLVARYRKDHGHTRWGRKDTDG